MDSQKIFDPKRNKTYKQNPYFPNFSHMFSLVSVKYNLIVYNNINSGRSIQQRQILSFPLLLLPVFYIFCLFQTQSVYPSMTKCPPHRRQWSFEPLFPGRLDLGISISFPISLKAFTDSNTFFYVRSLYFKFKKGGNTHATWVVGRP